MHSRHALPILVVLASLIPVAAGSAAGDPTAFAPACSSPLIRNHRHCLDPPSVGDATLSGSSSTVSIGQRLSFSVTIPPKCPTPPTKGQPPCGKVLWIVLFGAALSNWGQGVHDTLAVKDVAGCQTDDRTCAFTVRYEPGADPSRVPDGSALRVSAITEIDGYGCSSTNGICSQGPLAPPHGGGWLDWKLRLKAAPVKREVQVTTLDRGVIQNTLGVVGETLRYQGSGWKARGAPITVAWGGKVLRRIAAAASFSGRFKLPTFNVALCKGEQLTFTQGHNHSAVTIDGRITQAVAYVKGDVTADGVRKLAHNTAACDGEHVKVPHDGVFVALGTAGAAAVESEGRYENVRVLAPSAHIDQHGGLLAPAIRLGFLAHPVTLRFGALAKPVSSYDFGTGAPDVVNLTETQYQDLKFSGYYRSDHSITIKGHYEADRGVLYVIGTLTVDGGASAAGGGLGVSTDVMTISGALQNAGGLISGAAIDLRGG